MDFASINEHQDRAGEPSALGVLKITDAQFLAGKLEGVTKGDQFVRLKAASAWHGTSSRLATPRRTVMFQKKPNLCKARVKGTTVRLGHFLGEMIAADQHKGTVLVVEDEPLIRTYMRDVLEDGGYSTEAAGDAHQALELLERDGYEAVLTDIEIPGELNGLDLAWIIEVKWPHIGVVVTSGKCLPAPKDLPLTARFVAKPVPVDVLLQAVEDVIED